MLLLEETDVLGKNKSSWSWEAEIILCRRYLVWGLMEFLRLDGNISWIEISFTGGGGGGLSGSRDTRPRESLGAAMKSPAAPASVLFPGRSWRGPRSLLCERRIPQPQLLILGSHNFPGLPLPFIWLFLLHPSTQIQALEPVWMWHLPFSWFRGEPATGVFVWETQKSHDYHQASGRKPQEGKEKAAAVLIPLERPAPDPALTPALFITAHPVGIRYQSWPRTQPELRLAKQHVLHSVSHKL